MGLEYHDHPQVLTIKYEDLVTNYSGEVDRVMQFIGEEYVDRLDDYPECVEVQYSDKSMEGSNAPVRPIGAGSVGRWKKSEHDDIVNQIMSDDEAVRLLNWLDYM